MKISIIGYGKMDMRLRGLLSQGDTKSRRLSMAKRISSQRPK